MKSFFIKIKNKISEFHHKYKNKRKTSKVFDISMEVISLLLIIFAAFCVAVIGNIYVIRVSNVIGTSMMPTYQDGQTVLISRLPYVFGDPEPGDVIVFDHTKQIRTFSEDVEETLRDNVMTRFLFSDKRADIDNRFYIKRVIATSGDVVSVHGGQIYINGELLTNDGYLILNPEIEYTEWEGMTWTVPQDEIFVMGDNRGNSIDSRYIGTIPEGCILGKVVKQ